MREHFKEIYGRDYAQTCPQAATLCAEIDRIFDARAKRTAQERYNVWLYNQWPTNAYLSL